MNQLLQHFKTLTTHPKNAQELKGLVLQLAVQGKLTKHWRMENPKVEPASVLLEKIAKEKAQLIKEKKIRQERVKKEFAKFETEYLIPRKWISSNITEVYHTIGGKQNQIKTDQYFDKGMFPIVSQGKSLIEGYTDDYEKVLILNKPVIVFGDHTREVKFIDFDFVIGADGTKILVPLEGINSNYFYMFLCSIDLSSRGYARHYSHLKNEAIPIPPLEEQKAIVEVVNQLFEEIEELEQQTKARIQLKQDYVTSALQQLANGDTAKEWANIQSHFSTFFTEKSAIKKLRESILQLAVQGKLTRDWRALRQAQGSSVESAAVLLEKIKAEKAQLIKEGKIKKEKPLPPITEDEIPYELPESWVWCRLGESLLYSDAGKSPNCEKRPVEDDEWGVLTTTAIQQNRFNERANKILPSNFDVNPQQIVEEGDILITRAGPINRTGIACKVNSIQYNLILSDKTIRLKYIKGSLFPDFIVLTLNSSQIRELLLGKMIGMASSQVNISQSNIKGICFPMPPLAEQKAIVEKVNALMGLCDELEKEIKANTTQVEQLMQSCLKEVLEDKPKSRYEQDLENIRMSLAAEGEEEYK